MPHLLSLAKIVQSLLEPGSVVPARLRDRLPEDTAQAVERALRALAEVARQQHHQARASGTYAALHEEQDTLLAEIAIQTRAVRSDLTLTPQEAVRRILLIVGFARTVLDNDPQLEEQLGPGVGAFFEKLDRVEFRDGTGG
ncbi:hypothetical protein [Nitrospira lenta]|uniref:Uncharacterized protein n=1 Tax=Nitrospira lenta TaxID=1436998 RepID=A0A330L3G2_9BACT|nr:hypothetical protein [Nitrospira lenta]SPP64222.1 hypothetical protein NITLEN_100092 [Nitrospira lenta]